MLRGLLLLSSAVAVVSGRSLQQGHPHIVAENRVGRDWNYIPNYGYPCNQVGCCGEPTPARPTRQACGPEFWRFLNNDTFERCVLRTGGQQSPINFQTMGNDSLTFVDIGDLTGRDVEGVKKATLKLSKEKCPAKLEFLANTWEVTFADNCTLHVDVLGQRWHLANWHLHNAEHAVNGLYYPLEVHMVHHSEDNGTLVIAVFLTTGKRNAFFDALKSDSADAAFKPLDPYDIVPDDHKYWHYTGSLTTPPCQTKSGGKVEWFVMQTPDTVTTTDLYQFTSYFSSLEKAYDGRVNRPLQDILATTSIYTSPLTPGRRRLQRRTFA